MSEELEIKNFEPKDTKSIQLKSLYEFMLQFGYGMSAIGGFEDYCHRYTDKNRISFRTAVNLHNNGNLDNHGQVYERFGFDLYTWEKAKGSKIVDQVFLTLNKKTGYIHCHKHLVKLTRPFYEHIFLGGKK